MELNIWISHYSVHGKEMFSCGGMHADARRSFSFVGRGETPLDALNELLSHLVRD